MTSVTLLRAPAHARSGDDAFSRPFAESLERHFSRVTLGDIWPDWHHRLLHASPLRFLPFRHRIYSRTLLYHACRKTARDLPPDDTVCIRGEFWPGDRAATFEREIARSHRYVYNLIDNWFAIPGLEHSARARCDLAHTVVVPTERLRDVCSSLFPSRRVRCIEEPVNTSRFTAAGEQKAEAPTLVWAGNPYSHRELEAIRDILKDVYDVVPFKLHVLSGYQKPRVRLDIPWDWIPFSPANEQRIIPTAWAGFCFLRDDDYSACKGCYKMKTYMSAGTVPVVTNIGHARQVLTKAGTGILVDDNATEAWKAALIGCLRSRDEAVRGGQAARRYAEVNFGFPKIADAWAEVIREAR